MQVSEERPSRTRSIVRHLGRNVVAYLALIIAVSMSPLPSWAAQKIGTDQLKNGAVTTPKLAKNAVTSKKIKDGAVAKADLADGARGYTTIVTKRVTVADVDIAEGVTNSVRCDEGQVAIGGGASVTPGGVIFLGGSAGELVLSHPVNPFTLIAPTGTSPSGDGVAPTGWRSTVVNNTGENDRSALFWAICASK